MIKSTMGELEGQNAAFAAPRGAAQAAPMSARKGGALEGVWRRAHAAACAAPESAEADAGDESRRRSDVAAELKESFKKLNEEKDDNTYSQRARVSRVA